jgi:hypothetical protein
MALAGSGNLPTASKPFRRLTPVPDTPEVAGTEERQTERAVSPENGLLGVPFLWRSNVEPGLTNRPCRCLFTFSARLRFLWCPTQDIAACTLVLLAGSFRRSPGSLIGWVLVYNIAWMFVLGGIRLLTERFAAYRTAQQTRSVHW